MRNSLLLCWPAGGREGRPGQGWRVDRKGLSLWDLSWSREDGREVVEGGITETEPGEMETGSERSGEEGSGSEVTPLVA